jgi:hypothetical protein
MSHRFGDGGGVISVLLAHLFDPFCSAPVAFGLG